MQYLFLFQYRECKGGQIHGSYKCVALLQGSQPRENHLGISSMASLHVIAYIQYIRNGTPVSRDSIQWCIASTK